MSKSPKPGKTWADYVGLATIAIVVVYVIHVTIKVM